MIFQCPLKNRITVSPLPTKRMKIFRYTLQAMAWDNKKTGLRSGAVLMTMTMMTVINKPIWNILICDMLCTHTTLLYFVWLFHRSPVIHSRHQTYQTKGTTQHKVTKIRNIPRRNKLILKIKISQYSSWTVLVKKMHFVSSDDTKVMTKDDTSILYMCSLRYVTRWLLICRKESSRRRR